MNLSFRRTLPLALLCAMLFTAGGELAAQPQFILKRTKREGIPLFFQLFAGYNWVNAQGKGLEEDIFDYDENTYGGVLIGLQAALNFDSLARKPLWIGVEVNYKRIVDRHLAAEPDVYYQGFDPPSAGGPKVNYIEQVYALNSNLFVAYDLHPNFQLQAGGGVQFFMPNAELPETGLLGEVMGLLESTVYPTVFGAANVTLLSYDHGGINGNIRAVQGLHDYGSFEVQFLLGFMFNF